MLHSRVSRRFVAALLFVPLASAVLRADVKVQSPIGSHMGLQRDRPIPVHGTAARDEEVTVEFAGQTKSARAHDKGRWSVTLDPL
ncbi:MAG: sialate O-acetylesterase, partial [Planctomycetia bacterium]